MKRLLIAASLIFCTNITMAGTNVWTPVGPYGGYVQTLAVDPSNASILYAGFAWDGGIWKTVDGGGNWQRSSAGIGTYGISNIAVSPSTPLVVACASGGPLYRSTDGGATWLPSSGAGGTSSCGQFAFDANNALAVYYVLGNDVYKSIDAAVTWTLTASGPSSDGAAAFVATPAALFIAYSRAGVYKSTDGGMTWNPSNGSLPFATGPNYRLSALAADPADASLLYTFGSDNLLYKTTDGGTTWTSVSSPAFFGSKLAVQPVTRSIWAYGSDTGYPFSKGLWRSSDGGTSFTRVNGSHSPSSTPRFNGSGASPVYTVMDQGVYKTTDDGLSWVTAHGGLRAHRGTVAFSPSSATTYWLGLYTELAKTTDSGGSFTEIPPPTSFRPPFGEAIAVHPTNPDKVVTAGFPTFFDSNTGILSTNDGGTTWTAAPVPAGLHQGPAQLWSVAFDGSSPNSVFLGTTKPSGEPTLYTSNDAGATITGVASHPGSAILGLALIHPTPSTTTLYTASNFVSPGLHRSTDGGTTWQPLTAGLGTAGTAYDIVVHPTSPSIVFAATNAAPSGLYRSTDGGDTWAAFGDGLPQRVAPISVAIDPVTPNTMYAGYLSFEGVYQSLDGGSTWRPFAAGLPYRGVMKVAIDPHNHNHVMIGTQGSSVWEITIDPSLAPPVTPGAVNATATSATEVTVTWPASTGAATYEIARASVANRYNVIASTAALSYVDRTVSPGSSYLYKVRAIDDGGHQSSFSAPDIATTIFFSDDPLVPSVTTVRAQHLDELRQAANAVRALSGQPSIAFTDPVASAAPAIKAVHVSELRTGISSPRASLGLAPITLTDATLNAGVTIKAAHMTELREAVK